MRIARLFLCCLILGQALSPAFAGDALAKGTVVGPGFVPVVAGPRPVVGGGTGAANLGAPRFGDITGALGRRAKDPGLVRKMWFVYADDAELARAQEGLALIREQNPGVDVVYLKADALPPLDASREGKTRLFQRIVDDGAEFVLASNSDLYERFRSLRDADLARDIPFGFAGRKSVSVDIPRASLNPEVLSDPLRYSKKNFLVISEQQKAVRSAAGMEGRSAAFRQLLKESEKIHGAAKKDEDLGFVDRVGMKALMRLSGQADDRETARVRQQAHRLAAALEREKTDVLVTDDPEAVKAVALMKRMGYHNSLPVVWNGKQAPPDAGAVNLAVAPRASLEKALAEAKALKTLPDNFMEMGGVSVKDFDPKVAEILKKALPPVQDAKGKRFDVHFLLTNGNGVKRKGDSNPFGHFGMAVTDEKGRTLVWTVEYNDGGSFTGGLGPGQQLTLAEYLYSMWYLPGAAGQAVPQGETAGAPVYDFVLRGAVDEAGLDAMRRVAAAINARHLKGEDNYSFLNKHGATNCISLVTQLLRAGGFAIAESGIQAPADKAVEMIGGLARQLLTNEAAPDQLGLIVFERPAQGGPAHYRIPNTALGSPLYTRKKMWRYMTVREKLERVLTFPKAFVGSFSIPDTIDAFAAMATHRMVVGPQSRELEIVANPDSPIAKLKASAALRETLREKRVPIEQALAAMQKRILAEGSLPKRLRARYHRLEVALSLNLFDEQIAQRAIDFHKIEVADPTGRYKSRLVRLAAVASQVHAFRDTMVREDRILNAKELEALDRLNAEAETELERIQIDILHRLGPRVPHDMKQVSRQVDLDTLDALLGKVQAPDPAKVDSVTTYPAEKTPAMKAGIKVVADPQEGFLAKVMMIRSAKRTIDMSTYIFKRDAIGYAILGELRKASQRGVKVRLMVDSLGSLGLTHPELKALGFETVIFNSVWNPPMIADMLKRKIKHLFGKDDESDIYRWRNRRSHDKILLIDRDSPADAVAMVGGRNIADHYYGLPKVTPDTFNDMEIVIRSRKLSETLGAHYDRLFSHLGNKTLAPEDDKKEVGKMAAQGNALLVRNAAVSAKLAAMEQKDFLNAGFSDAKADFVNEIENITRHSAFLDPDGKANRPNGDSIVENFRKDVLAAKKSLVFISPYMWLEKDEIARLKAWLEADPERSLTIVSNSIMTTDNVPAQALVDHFLAKEFEGTRARIYAFGRMDGKEFGGKEYYGKLHAKYAIVDGKVGIVTTSNADPRSRRLNSEVGFIFRGDAVSQLNAEADKIVGRSYLYGSEEWKKLRQEFPIKRFLETLLAFYFRHTLFSKRMV